MALPPRNKGFRYSTGPNYYAYQPSVMEIIKQANKEQIHSLEPARDNRYPAFAGPMADGRLVTDYRTHCYENIEVGKQFATKHWMQANAEIIMDTSRRRQQEWSGGSLPILDLGPPPADIQRTNADTFEIAETNYAGGLGIERADQNTDQVYFAGAFYYPPSLAEERNNISKIRGTVDYEGGRNSPRGRITRPPSNGPIFAKGVYDIVTPHPKGADEEVLTGRPYLR